MVRRKNIGGRVLIGFLYRLWHRLNWFVGQVADFYKVL